MESDPITIEEAVNRPGKEGKEWEVSQQTEWQNMIDHDVFGPPTIPPPGTKVLRMGTALRATRQNGEITKRKTCIVVKGFSQVPGLHYNETYAPVMQWGMLCILLSIGATFGQSIRQFDVKSAYLHGEIQEEVWVEQPNRFKLPGKEDLPMRLKKALYGAKQGGDSGGKH